MSKQELYCRAFALAMDMMDTSGLEPTSALRQAANFEGMEWGSDELSCFVQWGLAQIN